MAGGDSQMWKQVFVRRTWTEDDKEDFLDAVYWFRQMVAFVIGVIWGVLPLYGAFGLAGYAIVSSLLTFVYVTKFQGANEEEFGGTQEILKEGFMTASATFIVMWIVMYTGLHN